MQRIRLTRGIMFFLIGIIFFFLFTSFVAFFSYVKPSKIVSDITPQDLGLSYEDVSFLTRDNLTLKGWFIPQSSDAKTIIVLHGWPADKGNILPATSFLAEQYNLFLFDFRALGKSQGKYSTLGARETEDLLAAIRYLKSRGIDEVGIWGFSMGGAVAFMASPQASEIKAIVSESSYARLDLMTSETFRIPLLRHPLGYFTGLWAKVLLGINIRQVAPVESAKQMSIPVLLIHSMDDDVIPFSHAQFLKDALRENPKAEFWFQESLFHGQFSRVYQQRITDFFKRNL